MKNSRLGRGLDAILGEVEEAYEKDTSVDKKRVYEIDIDAIRTNPYQPRKKFDQKSLEELAKSIKEHGLLQPIIVIEDIDGFMLIAGERRLRASKLAGLKKINAIIADIEPKKYRELALIENIQREDLNPIDLALSYKALIEDYKITHEELSSIVHKSRVHITNTLRLLSLSEYTKNALKEGKITIGHAKVLVGLDDEKQKIIVDSIIGQKMSVRDVENLAKKEKKKSLKDIEKESLDLSEIALALKKSGFKFFIKGNKVTVEFRDNEEISNFLERFLRKNY